MRFPLSQEWFLRNLLLNIPPCLVRGGGLLITTQHYSGGSRQLLGVGTCVGDPWFAAVGGLVFWMLPWSQGENAAPDPQEEEANFDLSQCSGVDMAGNGSSLIILIRARECWSILINSGEANGS